ncbi:MAG: 30S ribosomal protein S8 [Pseudomonadota bacterium]
MAMSDPLADMLTRIRNGQQAGKDSVSVPASQLTFNVLSVLKREGFILDFDRVEIRKGIASFSVILKYFDNKPVIHEMVRVSKPGRRVYAKIGKLGLVYNGLGLSILSTPKGVMADHEARKMNVGGEVLCNVL